MRPPRFPLAIAIKYADANDAVTKWGNAFVKISPIIGLATDISPMPPVANNVEVEKRSQN